MDGKSQIQFTSYASDTLPSRSCRPPLFFFGWASFNIVNGTPHFRASKSTGLHEAFLTVWLSTQHGALWDCRSMKCPPDTDKIHKYNYNKTNQMHQFPKFTPAWNSTCFGQFLCTSSGVYSLYSFRAGAYAPARKLSTNRCDIYQCRVYSE